MRIDSGEGGLIPEEAIMIEESPSPAETVVIFVQDASVDPLQSPGSENNLTVALRKVRAEKKGGLFKNPHHLCSIGSTPSRPRSVVNLNIEDWRQKAFEGPNTPFPPWHKSHHWPPRVKDDLTPLNEQIEGVLKQVEKQAEIAHKGHTLALLALQQDAQTA